MLASGRTDARYGNGIVSPDFNLFGRSRSIIQKLADDLTKIMMTAVKSDIYIYDSFFNIFSAGEEQLLILILTALDEIIALDWQTKVFPRVLSFCRRSKLSRAGYFKTLRSRRRYSPM